MNSLKATAKSGDKYVCQAPRPGLCAKQVGTKRILQAVNRVKHTFSIKQKRAPIGG